MTSTVTSKYHDFSTARFTVNLQPYENVAVAHCPITSNNMTKYVRVTFDTASDKVMFNQNVCDSMQTGLDDEIIKQRFVGGEKVISHRTRDPITSGGVEYYPMCTDNLYAHAITPDPTFDGLMGAAKMRDGGSEPSSLNPDCVVVDRTINTVCVAKGDCSRCGETAQNKKIVKSKRVNPENYIAEWPVLSDKYLYPVVLSEDGETMLMLDTGNPTTKKVGTNRNMCWVGYRDIN